MRPEKYIPLFDIRIQIPNSHSLNKRSGQQQKMLVTKDIISYQNMYIIFHADNSGCSHAYDDRICRRDSVPSKSDSKHWREKLH